MTGRLFSDAAKRDPDEGISFAKEGTRYNKKIPPDDSLFQRLRVSYGSTGKMSRESKRKVPFKTRGKSRPTKSCIPIL